MDEDTSAAIGFFPTGAVLRRDWNRYSGSEVQGRLWHRVVQPLGAFEEVQDLRHCVL